MNTEQDVIQRLAGQMMEAAKRERELGDQLYQAAFKIVALETVNEKLVVLVRHVQAILGAYLPPDGSLDQEAITALLELFDGPESRAALTAAGDQP